MIKSFVYVSGGNTIRQGITFLSQLWLARILGGAAFGDLTLAFSWFLIMAAVGDLGTRLYSWRHVAVADPGRRDHETVRLFGIRLRIAVIVALALNGLIWLLVDGRLALLLHWYTLGVVLNQATFDWVFMARGLYGLTFAYTVASGLLYVSGLVMLVRGVDQLSVVPVMFAVSYGLIGLIGLACSLDRRALVQLRSRVSQAEVVRIVATNWRLLIYDLLQRGQSVAIILIASWFYDAPAIAQFRIPHLVYGFVAATGVFLASSLFTETARAAAHGKNPAGVARGTAFLACLFVPLGIFGDDMLGAPLAWFLQGSLGGYETALQVLVASMVLAALGNFAREVSVSTGEAAIALQSYLTSIAVIAISLIAYHPPSVTYLAVVLVAAEVVGLAVMCRWTPMRLAIRAMGMSVLVSLMVGVALEQLWTALNRSLNDGRSGYLLASITVGVLFSAYLFGAVRFWFSPANDLR